MEQTIEILCEKFGVTVDGLVNELFIYHTTMDKISLVAWGVLLVSSMLSIWVFWHKFCYWYKENNWRIIFFAFPLAFIFIGLIVIPLTACDLIEWYVSPLGAALNLIM